MKQLSGMDSMFLYLENQRAPLELASLQIYDPSTAPGGKVRFKEILALFQDRRDRADVFRQKLEEVPLSLDHPYWVDDDDFDLEYHVRHIALPKPGTWQQLMTQTARLLSRSLDRSKPLWMAHVIEGLDAIPGLNPGCFAVLVKIHHAAIDGVTGQAVQTALHDLEPRPFDAASYVPSSGPGIEDTARPWKLLARAPFHNALNVVQLGVGLARAAPGILRAGLSTLGREHAAVPKTVFNSGRVSPHRVVDACFFDLAEIKCIRARLPETKINDIALSIVGGALRYYLESKDALPEQSLVASCPINVGTADDAHDGRGNLLSMMTPPMHTEIEDPVERALAVRDSTEDAKSFIDKLGSRTMTEIPMHLPAPLAKNLFPLLGELVMRSGSLPYNTMVSNVIGIQQPIYLAGARMIRFLGAGPVIDNAGIFHAVYSYDGTVSITFVACREMLPDPAFYKECIEASYEDLRSATIGKPKARARVARKKTRRKKKAAGKATSPAAAAQRKKSSKKPSRATPKTGETQIRPSG